MNEAQDAVFSCMKQTRQTSFATNGKTCPLRLSEPRPATQTIRYKLPTGAQVGAAGSQDGVEKARPWSHDNRGDWRNLSNINVAPFNQPSAFSELSTTLQMRAAMAV